VKARMIHPGNSYRNDFVAIVEAFGLAAAPGLVGLGLVGWILWRGRTGVDFTEETRVSNRTYYRSCHDGRPLPEADRYSDCLLRLPLFFDLAMADVVRVCDVIYAFFR